VHKLTCENHAAHENDKNWSKARDSNHQNYINELADKHEAELKHIHEQGEHDMNCQLQ